jgi:hypothetical protein
MEKYTKQILKLLPIAGALVINDWNNIKNNYGFVISPTIYYYPSNNIELVLGSYILDGRGSNIFGSIKNLDELVFRLKVNF